ncbi:hypothetical protein L211DRAFT_853906 [Terfezia boudieri ATCC MYA-4762]|uniref:Uncharacterized protein n=1 Tax=Terfezia boudieri ATCC MYA-4762 TaxID=1051890 RepID=A0A3N4LB35_9PEZI|nr:hypothetical protein L211DRAFT_853906 [Terfezia boudieri ATCC MYA-4762]
MTNKPNIMDKSGEGIKRKCESKAKFDYNGNRLETRDRLKKLNILYTVPHWKTIQVQEAAVPKLQAIQHLVEEGFGSLRGFLRAWFDNPVMKSERNNFMLGGAREMIELWLPKILGMESSGSLEVLIRTQAENDIEREIEELTWEQGSIL